MTEKRFEINQDDMLKSATEFEALLDKYRNQPDMVDGKPTWRKEVQDVYNKVIPLIRRAKNGEITEPISGNFRPIGYYFDDTPVGYTYPDLDQAYSVFILDIQGMRRGTFAEAMKKILQKSREKAMQVRKENGLD